MGVIDDLEDDAGFLLFLILIGLGVLVFLAVKRIKIPESMYPESIFDSGATGIDTTLSGLPSGVQAIGGPVKNWIDGLLGTIGAWIDDNLPRTPSETQALQGAQQVGDDGTDSGEYAQVDTGDGEGN